MGIPGNEQADEQADEEAKATLDDDLEQNEEYPPNYLENWLKAETAKNRKERWRNGNNNNWKTEHKYDEDTRAMTRREQVVISRLRMGHTRATYGPRMNRITNPQSRSALFVTPGSQLIMSYGTAKKRKKTKEIWGWHQKNGKEKKKVWERS
jgi:hypothetical protein